jgi:hypothetical protein
MLAETMNIDGGSAIAVIVIVAFAIERSVTGLLFLLPFNKQWAQRFPDPASLEKPTEKARAEKKQKLLYYGFASLLGLIVAGFGNVRLLHALGLNDSRLVLDIFVTVLVLIAGSDILGHIQKLSGAPGSGKSSQQPIEISGRLILEESGEKKQAGTP